MTKTVALTVNCTCNNKKQFNYPVQLEKSQNGSEAVSLLIDCPFHYEKNCIRHLSIQLPPGMVPKSNDDILRG